jgi:DNA polymerase
MILFSDTETFCEVPIRNGTHIYAESAEIMLVQYAVDDGPVTVRDLTAGDDLDEFKRLAEKADTVVFHNSGFDRTVLRHNGIVILPEKIHCTMVQALSHGLPGGLDKLCGIFGVPVDQAKDKRGKALVQLFCKLRPKNSALRRATAATHPAEWKIFVEDYAPSDVEAMRAIYKKMPRWNYPAAREHALWVLDQKINDRGFAVDQELARAAIATVDATKKNMDAATGDLTFGEVHSTTQRDALLKHLLASWGVELPDMQKSTLERRLADEELPWPVRELIAIRLQVSTTSNAKYNSLLKAVSADGRLRGTMQFCGAARTKRWAGRTWQPQNLPRPDMEAWDIEVGIDTMKAGPAAVRLLYDEPMKLASNAIRGCIVAAEGRKLVVSDLEQVEARTLPWLAGEQWELDAFAAYDRGEGFDNYRVNAGHILGKHPGDVTKDERQAYGKVVVLSCGYGGSVGAFAQFAKIYGVDLPEHEIFQIVRDWRALHPKLCDWDAGFWKQLDDAARQAIRAPGKTFTAGDHIRFERWREWLQMELPSGGFLSYAAPAIMEDPRRPGNQTVSYMGVNNYTRKWERLYTYGGKLSADATQATAREIMAYNLPAIEADGYPILLLCHDEVVTEPLDVAEFSIERLNALLAAQPPWAKDLPLAADGYETKRYRK